LILVVTTFIWIFWSREKVLWYDEFLSKWTDSVPRFTDIIHIQLTHPACLDPLFYHLMGYVSVSIFGSNAFALRLPSLIGFLLLEISLFIFVQRIASKPAAFFAMVMPILSPVFRASVQGRPYGLALGLIAAAMVCWQSARRGTGHRNIALAGLSLSIFLAINTHYYGALVLVPLCFAELWMSWHDRRSDWRVSLAIALGATGIAFALPFMKGAEQFRSHFYDPVGQPSRILDAYAVALPFMSIRLPYIQLAPLALLSLSLSNGITLLSRKTRTQSLLFAETILLIAFFAFPILGYLLALFVTHTFEERFVLGSIIGSSAIFALGIDPLLQRRRIARLSYVLLSVLILFQGYRNIADDSSQRKRLLNALKLDDGLKQDILKDSGARIYFQNPFAFVQASYYEPDPEVRSRITLVYSWDQETRWGKTDTISRTVFNLTEFSTINAISYESLAGKKSDRLLISYPHSKFDWIEDALAASRVKTHTVGPAFGGTAEIANFTD
jgi:hypothetical protein